MENNEEKQIGIEQKQQDSVNKEPNPQIPPQYHYTASDSARDFVMQTGSQFKDFAHDRERLERTGLICAAAGFVISFIFTIITCSRSASISINVKGIKNIDSIDTITMLQRYRVSYFFILVIIGAAIAVAGGIMAFMSRKGKEFGIMAKVTLVLVIVTLVFATIPNMTVCAYNNSLNNAVQEMMEDREAS